MIFFSEYEYERCEDVTEDTSAISVRWQESVELNRKNLLWQTEELLPRGWSRALLLGFLKVISVEEHESEWVSVVEGTHYAFSGAKF